MKDWRKPFLLFLCLTSSNLFSFFTNSSKKKEAELKKLQTKIDKKYEKKSDTLYLKTQGLKKDVKILEEKLSDLEREEKRRKKMFKDKENLLSIQKKKEKKDPRLLSFLLLLKTQPYEVEYIKEKIFPSLTEEFMFFTRCSKIEFSEHNLKLKQKDVSKMVEWLVGSETECGYKNFICLDDLKFILKQATTNLSACFYTHVNLFEIEQASAKSETIEHLLKKAKECRPSVINERK